MSGVLLANHYAQPYHMGPLADADTIGQTGVPGEGPYLTISLKVEGERIVQAWFDSYACPVAIACGSWLVHWAEGRTLSGVGVIDPEDLSRVLGGLPLGREHCAHMAVHALRDAVRRLQQEGERR